MSDHHDGVMLRLDPRSGRVLAKINGLGYEALEPFVAAGLLWTPSSETLTAISPMSDRLVHTFRQPDQWGASINDNVWVDTGYDTVVRRDPTSGRPLQTVKVSRGSGEQNCINHLTAGAGSLWSSVQDNPPDVPVIVRIGPDTGHILARITDVGDAPSVTVGPDGVWIVGEDGTVRTVDPKRNQVISTWRFASPDTGDCPDSTAAYGRSLWVAHEAQLFELDPVKHRIEKRLTLDAAPESMVAANGRLYVSLYDDGLVECFQT